MDDKTRKQLEGCCTELGASRTLSPKDDYNKGFNAGLEFAAKILRKYLVGQGLFQ